MINMRKTSLVFEYTQRFAVQSFTLGGGKEALDCKCRIYLLANEAILH